MVRLPDATSRQARTQLGSEQLGSVMSPRPNTADYLKQSQKLPNLPRFEGDATAWSRLPYSPAVNCEDSRADGCPMAVDAAIAVSWPVLISAERLCRIMVWLFAPGFDARHRPREGGCLRPYRCMPCASRSTHHLGTRIPLAA